MPDVFADGSAVFYLEVPANKIVDLQGYFELYEGLGLIRTLRDLGRRAPVLGQQEKYTQAISLVAVLTTVSQIDDCLAALAAVKGEIAWEFASLQELIRCDATLKSRTGRCQFLGILLDAPAPT